MRQHDGHIGVGLVAVEPARVGPDETVQRRELLGRSLVPVRPLFRRVTPLTMRSHEALACRIREGNPAAHQAGHLVLFDKRPVAAAGRGGVRPLDGLRQAVGEQRLVAETSTRSVMVGLGAEQIQGLVVAQVPRPQQSGVGADRDAAGPRWWLPTRAVPS